MNLDIQTPAVFMPLWRPARYKGAHGGRGSGKSHHFANMAVVALLSGRNVLCVREVQNSIAESVKRLLELKIDTYGLADIFDVTEKEIRCKTSGAYAIFRGMQNHTAANVKSLEGFHVAWWEEAQTASRRSLDLLIPTIREPGSEIWASWNPEDPSNPIEFLRHDPPEGAIVVEANAADNPFFPEELRRDMERDRVKDPDKYHHVWLGGYSTRSETRIFRNWRVERLDVPHGVRRHYGLDFGFAVDPTAGVRIAIWERKGAPTLYVENEVGGVGVATEALPALLSGLPEVRDHTVIADSARPETIDYLRRHGFPRVQAASKGKNSVRDGIEFLRGFDIVVSPECPNVERELTLYSYKTDRITGDILPDVEDAHNHWIDAIRYATERLHHRGNWRVPQLERAGKPRDYVPAGRSETADSWKVA